MRAIFEVMYLKTRQFKFASISIINSKPKEFADDSRAIFHNLSHRMIFVVLENDNLPMPRVYWSDEPELIRLTKSCYMITMLPSTENLSSYLE